MDQGQFGNLPRGLATNLLSRRQVLKSVVAGLFLPGSLGVILQSKGYGTKEDNVTNGKYLRLGKKDLADAVTALVKSGVGPALSLLVDSEPPLKANSQEKVDNLNSDMLDGEHASDLTRVAQIYELSVSRLPDDGSEITYGPQLSIEAPARSGLVGVARRGAFRRSRRSRRISSRYFEKMARWQMRGVEMALIISQASVSQGQEDP